MVDHDVQTNSVRIQGSHSRNLLKIKRGLEFLKVLFEQVLLTEYVHLIHLIYAFDILVEEIQSMLLSPLNDVFNDSAR